MQIYIPGLHLRIRIPFARDFNFTDYEFSSGII